MKYDVYGIGNALVDTEFEVSESFLVDNHIEKGFMTLIDAARHHELMPKLKSTFGIKKRTGGGSGANTIVAINRFGAKTFYACKVANDESGQFYFKDLQAAGVTARLDEIHTETKDVTGQCIVMVTHDAERTMNTYLGITANLSSAETHLDDLRQARYLYIEGYLVTSDTSRHAVLEARKVAAEHGIITALTFSDPSMAKYFRAGLSEIIGEGVDILFCNEEEALTYTETTDLESAISALQTITKKLVLTLGKEGALVISGTQRTPIAPVKTTVVDTNGAGDMFAGAFMYGLTQGMSDGEAGALASRAAGKIISVFGSRLSQREHEALLEG